MFAFALIFCSALLFSSAIAESPTEPTEVLKTTEVTAPAEETIGAEIGKATSAASLQVINDLLDGKELKDSVLDRGIEALAKIRGTTASMIKSFLKRVRELWDGTPIPKVVSNFFNSIINKFSGKNKKADEIIDTIGKDTLLKVIEGITKVIEDSIKAAVNKKKEQNEILANSTTTTTESSTVDA